MLEKYDIKIADIAYKDVGTAPYFTSGIHVYFTGAASMSCNLCGHTVEVENYNVDKKDRYVLFVTISKDELNELNKLRFHFLDKHFYRNHFVQLPIVDRTTAYEEPLPVELCHECISMLSNNELPKLKNYIKMFRTKRDV